MPDRKLDFSQRARLDLQKIAAYLAEHAGTEVAAQFVIKLEEECNRLPMAPGMGAPYPNRLGIRKLNAGNYKIIYRASDTNVLILRVWDSRRGSEARF